MGDEYASVTTGKLKLKGVTDGRVEKKKKRKKPKSEDQSAQQNVNVQTDRDEFNDNSVILKHLADEHAEMAKEEHEISNSSMNDKDGPEDVRDFVRTESQKRFEEQRRKRLEERLKREGVKTHKQRVEELNKYLSSLSEHHDMPKIGPG